MISKISHHVAVTDLPAAAPLADSFASTVTNVLRHNPNPSITPHPSLVATHAPPLTTSAAPEQLKHCPLPLPEQVAQLRSHASHLTAEPSRYSSEAHVGTHVALAVRTGRSDSQLVHVSKAPEHDAQSGWHGEQDELAEVEKKPVPQAETQVPLRRYSPDVHEAQ